jgi:L-alanine-DL-glutamate epimerase-like enolase superfamily enzyme
VRIADVQVICLGFQRTTPSRFYRSYALTKITTDSGLVGWGESSDGYSHSMAPAVKAVVEDEIARLIVGADPTYPQALASRLKGFLHRTTNNLGIVSHAIAGVEIACWDILGKVLGLPVARLLGQLRDRIPVYASGTLTFDRDPEWYGPFFDQFLARGVGAVKVRIGKQFDWDVEVIRRTREHLGPERELLVDAKYNYSVPSALRLLDSVQAARIHLLEEPIPPHDLDGMARLAAATSTPIAYGESLTRLQDFRLLVDHRAANVLEPDVTIACGFHECLKIAALAEAWSMPLCPHSGGLSTIGIAANLHLAAAVPNLTTIEYDAAPEQPMRDVIGLSPDFGPNQIVGGCLRVPDGPGLGVEIDESAFAQYAYHPRPPEWENPGYGEPHV